MPTEEPPHASGFEHEVKFHADKASFAAVLGAVRESLKQPGETRLLVSTYYDTESHDLWHNGITLRIRKLEDGRLLFCMKRATDASSAAHGSPFLREEFEKETASLTPDTALLPAREAKLLSRVIGHEMLATQFITRVTRTHFEVAHEGAIIELAFDEGSIVAGRRHWPLLEIEAEIKSGSDEALHTYAEHLCSTHKLPLGFFSKSERGFRLLAQEPVSAVQASPVTLQDHHTPQQAVAAILNETLMHFVSNWDGLRLSEQPESVHQLRVALRRMRSAMSIFKVVMDGAALPHLKAEAKRIANGFSAARKTDVFLASLDELMFEDAVSADAQDAFRKTIEHHRRASYAAARDILNNPETSLFVLGLQTFTAALAAAPADAAQSLPEFATHSLVTFGKRALKRGRHITALSPEQLHLLRIALKKLRYAIGFLAPVLPHRKRWQAIARETEVLQEILGQINDAAETAAFLGSVPGLASQSQARCAGFVLGWHARSAAGHRDELHSKWKRLKAHLARTCKS